MFRNKVVVITGGAGGIGKCIAGEFAAQGAHVCVIDRVAGDHYVGDLGQQAVLEFDRKLIGVVYDKFGKSVKIIPFGEKNGSPPSRCVSAPPSGVG